MAGYVARRAAQAVVVMLGVSVLVFALVHLVPGDPIRASLGTRSWSPSTSRGSPAR